MRFRLYVVEKTLLAIPREWFGIDNRPVQLCLNNSPPHCGLLGGKQRSNGARARHALVKEIVMYVIGINVLQCKII